MKGKLIVVYGDIVADRFIYGTPKRISREAPVLILRQYRDDILLGGAGNAINNIYSLGGLPVPVSVLGNDAAGHALVEQLTAQGIDCGGILRTDRYNTPTKVRILGGMPHAEPAADRPLRHRRPVRDDGRRGASASPALLREQIVDLPRGADQRLRLRRRHARSSPRTSRGSRTASRSRSTRATTCSLSRRHRGDAERRRSRGGRGHVAVERRRRGDRRRSRARRCSRASTARRVLITRGSRGMALFERETREPLFIPVYGTDQVADVTGAGDTVIATFTLALAAGASYAEAAKLANYGGGIVVMKMGTATVSNDELRARDRAG